MLVFNSVLFLFAPDCVTYVYGLVFVCSPQTVLFMFLFSYLCVYPSLCGLCGPGVELPLQQLREVARPSWELGHHQRELVTTTK